MCSQLNDDQVEDFFLSWILTAYSSTEKRITWKKNVCKTQGTKAEQHTGRLVNYYEIIMFKLGQKRKKAEAWGPLFYVNDAFTKRAYISKQ